MKKPLLSVLLLILLAAAGLFLFRPRVSIAQGGGDPPPLISQVTVTRSSDQSTHVLESGGDRTYLDLSEAASVEVQLSPGGGVVHVMAPQGGRINGQRKIDIDTDQMGRDISFTFTPGDSSGRCYLEIWDDQRTETVAAFWVGPRPVLGRPGPDLTFGQ